MEELRQYINDLNNEFADITGGNFCKLNSGEIFTKEEVNKYIAKKIEVFNIERQADVNSVARENGIELEQRLINKRSKNKKKLKERYDGGDFNMLYRKEVDSIMAFKLTLVEEGVYSRLCKFIQYPTNCVMVNGQIPSIEILMNIMDLKERSLRGHLKTLCDKGLIKMVQCGHKKSIYVNPQYCASGKDLDIETLRMFNLIECDNEKVNSYL